MPKELEVHSRDADNIQQGTEICAFPCLKNPYISIFDLRYLQWESIKIRLDRKKIPYKVDGKPFHGANW